MRQNRHSKIAYATIVLLERWKERNASLHSGVNFQSNLPAAEDLLKLNVYLGILNVYSENLIFQLIREF